MKKMWGILLGIEYALEAQESSFSANLYHEINQ